MASGSCQSFTDRSVLDSPPPNPDYASSSRAACAESCGSSRLNNGNGFPFAGFISIGPENPYCSCLLRQSSSPGRCQTCERVGPCGIFENEFNFFVFPTTSDVVEPIPSPDLGVTSSLAPEPSPDPPSSSALADAPAPTEPVDQNPAAGEASIGVITEPDGSVTTTGVVNPLSERGSQLVSGPSTITMTSIGSNGVPTVFVVTQVATLGINSGGGPTLAPNESSGEGNGSTSKPSSVATVGAAIGGVFGLAAFAAVAMVIVFRRRRRRMKKSEEAAFYRRAAHPGKSHPPPNSHVSPMASTVHMEKSMQITIKHDDAQALPRKPEAAVSIYASATRFDPTTVSPNVSKLDMDTKASLFDNAEPRYVGDGTAKNGPFDRKARGPDGFPIPFQEGSSSMSHRQQESAQGTSIMGRSQTFNKRRETAPPPYAPDF
ncbi:hypothetical protein HDU67_000512 [Dinochytrium kinnereticum]|nr:hypothetical protein HDU67_000512 [Dinochytrium kinnereticum]